MIKLIEVSFQEVIRMSKPGKNPSHQFKENSNKGEHRNGRKSQYKNNTSGDGSSPNEYVSKRD